jgi:hypothetical protein
MNKTEGPSPKAQSNKDASSTRKKKDEKKRDLYSILASENSVLDDDTINLLKEVIGNKDDDCG